MSTDRLLLGALLAACTTFELSHGQAAASDPLVDARVLDAHELRQLFDSGEESVPVIVNLARSEAMRNFAGWRDPERGAAHKAEVDALVDVVLANLPPAEFALGRRLDNLPTFSCEITRRGLRALLSGLPVESVEYDEPCWPSTEEGIELIDANPVRLKWAGTGHSIAIVDSGVDYNHAAFGGLGFPSTKVLGGYDFGDDDPDPMDTTGHGTSVAGIAAGLPSGPADYWGGVAFFSPIYAVKVFADGATTGPQSDVLAGWDWCLTHQYDDPSAPIRVVNSSLGGGQNTSACSLGSYESTAALAANAGIVHVAASGNGGYCNAMASPACAPSVISVGAVYNANVGSKAFCVLSGSCVASASATCQSGLRCTNSSTAADQVTCYSNSASFLDLLAPSNDTTAPDVGGGYNTSFGGTSAASPFVAGAVACLLDFAEKTEIDLTPADVRARLVAAGQPIFDPKSGVTTPRLDLDDAMSDFADIFVDHSSIGPTVGSIIFPYTDLSDGLAFLIPGHTLRVRDGNYVGSFTIDKPMTLGRYGGASGVVSIGQ